MGMPYEMGAECPCCKVTAGRDVKEIDEIFGFREMSDGRKIPQSYCRKCRSAHCSKSEKHCS